MSTDTSIEFATTSRSEVSFVAVGDVDELELFEAGEGPPLLFLHGFHGLAGHEPALRLLAAERRVLAPSHPGYGRSSLPHHFDSIDDVVYVYLDLLDELDLRDVALVGCSLGGWIAAELALRAPDRLARLVLVDALGIRVGGREDRDIADVYVVGEREAAELAFHDPALAADVLAYERATDEELAIVARNQEATVLYGWEPYFCDPKLLRRLRRVRTPTLVVWGASDRIVTPAYGQAYADAIPGARLLVLDAAGHLPQVERPEAFVEAVRPFLAREDAR